MVVFLIVNLGYVNFKIMFIRDVTDQFYSVGIYNTSNNYRVTFVLESNTGFYRM